MAGHSPSESIRPKSDVMESDVIDDPELGRLEWDPTLEWWEGRLDLSSSSPRPLFSFSRAIPGRSVTPEARAAITRIRGFELACRGFAADQLLEVHNSEWSEGEPITKDEFVRRLNLDCIEIHESGYSE